MNLRKIMQKLQLEVTPGNESLSKEVKEGYASDLISNVLANAQEEDVPLLVGTLPAFELIGRLHNLGLSGLRG